MSAVTAAVLAFLLVELAVTGLLAFGVRDAWRRAERARFEVELWPGDVHGFLNVPVQRKALERSLEWLSAFHSQAATPAGRS